MYFCERLDGIGQQVWVNFDVRCLHIGHIGVGIDNFNNLKTQNIIQQPDDIVFEDEDDFNPNVPQVIIVEAPPEQQAFLSHADDADMAGVS